MAEGADAVPEWETQRHEITNITKKPLQKGDIWCLIDNKWYKQWKKYVGFDSWETSSVGVQTMHPGPIDNSPILREDGSDIKDHLIDELDYVLVPQEGWDLLSKWYGVAENQQCIARKVVEYGMFVKHCKVEVYLLEFKLCQNNDLEHCITRKFSKADTIGFIEEEMRTIFEIPPEKPIRLWNRYSSNTYEHLNNKESTVQDAGLYQGQILIIEPSNDDGTWQRQVKSTSAALTYTNSSGSGSGDNRPYNNPTNTIATRSYGSGYGSTSYNYDYQGSVSNGSVQPGLCGLSNLGNTCFMNSALQCMSNTPPLTEYFFENHYWEELNVDNPLGMHGEIAKSYGDLVKVMWSGRSSYTMPRNFKTIVGRFAPQFSGYAQQDCQELMAFLLDGLHEDLNRVKKKPYVELKDAGNRPDEDVSKEAWANYQMRNNSIIVDIFHGLLKSTLVCPECSKISVTFDPFCYLSLPLPVKKERQIEITLVTSEPEKRPIQMKITVSKLGIVQDLCDAISRVTSIPATNLIVADVYNHKLHKIFDMDEGLSTILDRDAIFVYENPLNAEDEDMLFIPVYLRLKRWKNIINGSSAPTLFAQPYFVPLPAKNCTYEILYSTILRVMMRFVRLPETKEDWDFIGSLEECHINGEVEMTNGDDCDSDPGEEEKEEMEELDNNIDKALKGFFLFSIQSVNSSGTVEVDKVVDEDGVVKLSKKTYLAAEFYENIKERFLDDKEAVARTVHESVNIRHTQKKQVIQLSECLELFTTTEKLGADDPWYCPFCKKHQQATKKFDLWQLPKVLIIHLKRFSYNRYWRDKLDTLVEFPINGLNMAKYVINQSHGPATYDLIAVANHYGGMGGGHYTAYGKNKTTGSWYYFDDSSVTNSAEDNVVSKAAYVLFYMRRDARDPNSSIRHANRQQTISAALGAPHNNQGSSPDEDGASSSDEDCSMDVN